MIATGIGEGTKEKSWVTLDFSHILLSK